MMITRRHALLLSAGAVAAVHWPPRAHAQSQPIDLDTERHGMSAFGDLALPADFKHFPYVNPDAPKGGAFSESIGRRTYNGSFLTFNSLNTYILKGDGAYGMDWTFATLMVKAGDELDAMYGLAARSVRISDNGLTYRFTLRDNLTFHDGSPLTVHDVVWSLNTLKEKGHPIITQLLNDLDKAEAEGDRVVVARFKPGRGREVPLFVAGLPILSKAYYAKKSFDESTLDIPLGSGPYKVGRFEVGRYIEYERVKGWWGAKLPVEIGQNNFDTIRYEYYRDRDVAFVGFTAKNYLFREEFTARTWATRYDFPAIKDGKVKRDTIPDDTPSGAQGWFMNTRRDKFKDRRVREALIDAFDFEYTNKNIMYDAYLRTHSVFQNSPMMARGRPDEAELKLLEPFRGKIPDEVFGEPYVPPVTDASGQDRRVLRIAAGKLNDAGIVLKDGKRVLPNGQPFTIEFLSEEPSFNPHHLAYIKNLELLGIPASLRVVDPVQYRARVDTFDFDLTVERMGFSSTPGDSLRSYFMAQAAKINGSKNLAGIADPAVDALVEKIVAAATREDLIAACKALDRLIRAGRYWIPQWYLASHRIAYWDVFGRPARQPRYDRGIPDIWWAAEKKG
ncbi:extracellular solute-binding protein [Undibacter mobilis]|uniref:ABC transporter substrate-binding protein n=1 Tax=Undibacter mobilis TaxID=2292256 RepID=A0A371BA38_9BRAD|nr:extracellular solute-binding protein [Undibacter mobilis]RDV04456.1 ABC transporter substrate-binding protein [Undibacter mobilis]